MPLLLVGIVDLDFFPLRFFVIPQIIFSLVSVPEAQLLAVFAYSFKKNSSTICALLRKFKYDFFRCETSMTDRE